MSDLIERALQFSAVKHTGQILLFGFGLGVICSIGHLALYYK